MSMFELSDNVYLSFVIAARVKDDTDVEHFRSIGQNVLFGFVWWSWFPNFRKTSIGWSVTWLCFGMSYDNYNNIKNG
jgi:hypothetical protein